VTDELSSSGDSKTEDDADKKSPKDKDSKEREREEGIYYSVFILLMVALQMKDRLTVFWKSLCALMLTPVFFCRQLCRLCIAIGCRVLI
jgi:hypothetical protein